MKIQTKIQKWGNGLGLRVSGIMRDIPHFEENTFVEVEVTEEGFEVKKMQSDVSISLPFSEAELLEDMTPHSAHADILAKPLNSEF